MIAEPKWTKRNDKTIEHKKKTASYDTTAYPAHVHVDMLVYFRRRLTPAQREKR